MQLVPHSPAEGFDPSRNLDQRDCCNGLALLSAAALGMMVLMDCRGKLQVCYLGLGLGHEVDGIVFPRNETGSRYK